MTTRFDSISGSIRKPGVYFEFNSKLGNSGLPGNMQKTLIIAQRIAAGTVAEKVPTAVFSEAEAAAYFGTGSMAHLMARAAFGANPYLDLTICTLADAGGGTAATWTVTMTGPATAAGLLKLWIGYRLIQIAIANGDAANAIAAALNAEIAKYGDLPVTAAVNNAVVTLTARNKGTVANQVDVSTEVSATAVTAVVAVGVAGATDPTLQDALDKVFAGSYDVVITPYNDATNLQTLRTHLRTVAGPMEQRGGIGAYAFDGSLANATTLSGTNVNDGFISGYFLRGTKSPAYEMAAAYGAVIASEEDPARPLNGLQLTGIHAPDVTQRLSRTEQESCLANGASPGEVDAQGVPCIVRAISTYVTNAAGVPDVAWLDITTARSMFYGRRAMRERIALRFPREKIVEKTPARVRSEILDVAYRLEALEIWTGIDTYKDGFTVEKNGQSAGRLDCVIPSPVVPGLHVLAARMDLIL